MYCKYDKNFLFFSVKFAAVAEDNACPPCGNKKETPIEKSGFFV